MHSEEAAYVGMMSLPCRWCGTAGWR